MPVCITFRGDKLYRINILKSIKKELKEFSAQGKQMTKKV